MMGITLPRRGRPLVVLTLVFASWTAARVIVWQDEAFAAFRPGRTRVAGLIGGVLAAEASVPSQRPEANPYSPWPQAWTQDARAIVQAAAGPPMRLFAAAPAAPAQAAAAGASGAKVGWFGYFLPAGSRSAGAAASEGAWHASVDLAARDDAARTGPGGNAAPAVAAVPQNPALVHRWSGDAWLLMRRDSSSLAATGPGVPTYGADQSGAVLRYALSLTDPRRPAAYARVTTALRNSNESELAVGLQARPVARIPIVALAEVRALREGGRVYARPAAMAVTQLPPLALPYGTVGDAYLQGGYVGGRFATPFVDGQVHVKKPLGRIGKGELSFGAGSWLGAQKGASRFDVGPEASWRFAVGKRAAASLSLDYRLEVAGNAKPGSGPALSVAAGF